VWCSGLLAAPRLSSPSAPPQPRCPCSSQEPSPEGWWPSRGSCPGVGVLGQRWGCLGPRAFGGQRLAAPARAWAACAGLWLQSCLEQPRTILRCSCHADEALTPSPCQGCVLWQQREGGVLRGAAGTSCGSKRNSNFSAGTARKRKAAFGSIAELREAALRLLDHHQNLNDLLLEVGAGGSGSGGQAGRRGRSQLGVGSTGVPPRATVE